MTYEWTPTEHEQAFSQTVNLALQVRGRDRFEPEQSTIDLTKNPHIATHLGIYDPTVTNVNVSGYPGRIGARIAVVRFPLLGVTASIARKDDYYLNDQTLPIDITANVSNDFGSMQMAITTPTHCATMIQPASPEEDRPPHIRVTSSNSAATKYILDAAVSDAQHAADDELQPAIHDELSHCTRRRLQVANSALAMLVDVADAPAEWTQLDDQGLVLARQWVDLLFLQRYS